MIERTLSRKIREYQPEDELAQELVLAELLQHFVLASLARAGLFRVAAFHGGTFLRIIHSTDRFSEDLDFVLKEPDSGFRWQGYVERVLRDCETEGIHFEVIDKGSVEAAVRKAFLKTDSLGGLLEAILPHSRHPRRKLRIKLEIDANPPAGSQFETQYLHFPVLTAITTQTLSSSFASKCHALLCRSYTKGRDWYDFLWYVGRGVQPDLGLLGHALEQQGPWAGQGCEVTLPWFLEQLRAAIERIDWLRAAEDVRRFLGSQERATLQLWNRDLFLHHLELLAHTIDMPPTGPS